MAKVKNIKIFFLNTTTWQSELREAWKDYQGKKYVCRTIGEIGDG
jgi:hypothetical protein